MDMNAFTDELIKIANRKQIGKFLQEAGKSGVLKYPAILGGGYVAGKGIEQSYKDWKLGRQVRKQYEG